MPKKFMRSFNFAREGVKHILRTQRNIRIHGLAGSLVILAALVLRASPVETAILVLTVTFVVVCEMFNTAVEEAVNLAKPGHDPLAGMIKNISAGSVLTAALGAVIVGGLVLWPKLIKLWNY